MAIKTTDWEYVLKLASTRCRNEDCEDGFIAESWQCHPYGDDVAWEAIVEECPVCSTRLYQYQEYYPNPKYSSYCNHCKRDVLPIVGRKLSANSDEYAFCHICSESVDYPEFWGVPF
jgi:hypothetical protein